MKTSIVTKTIATALFLTGIGHLYAQVPQREAVEIQSMQRMGDESIKPALLPPGNDACAAATVLTPGAACVSGTTNAATTQGGEYLCINPGGGISPETVWYRFTATSTSMVLGFVQTNSTNCATVLAAYGPFAPGTGCLPGSGNQILCQNMGLIDPGFHPQLTGLTVGQDYLVQVQGNNCGGGSDRFSNFCISIQAPASNTSASVASVISACGVGFTGTTAGGHFANGTSIGNNNLDNNAATSVAGASEVGDDVTFVINNVSWFSFCNGNASACNWSVNVNNITNCLLSGLNSGVQAAVFSGTPAALTNIAISPSRIAPGGSWSSGTFSLNAGACAYIAVDGFAGDECRYDLTLTAVSCPCLVLPVELSYFAGRNLPEHVLLDWQMAAADNIAGFVLERGMDGNTFSPVSGLIPADKDYEHRYTFSDPTAMPGWNYYRLSARDLEGNVWHLNTVAVFRQQGASLSGWATPGDGFVHLDVFAPAAGDLTVEILDMQGRRVQTQEQFIPAGSSTAQVQTPALTAGMYLVRMTLGNESITRRISLQ